MLQVHWNLYCTVYKYRFNALSAFAGLDTTSAEFVESNGRTRAVCRKHTNT
jgi:hypothetical protein